MTSVIRLAPARSRRRSFSVVVAVGIVAVMMIVGAVAARPAAAAQAPVPLGTDAPFAVLGGSEVTDVPISAITGDVGLYPAPGSAYTGLTQAEVTGTIYARDATAPILTAVVDPSLLLTAQNDLTTAFTFAAGQVATRTGVADLTGLTLGPGVYNSASTMMLDVNGTLHLNGNGVFIFQVGSGLTTFSNSKVLLEGGAQAGCVFWEVVSQATLGTGSTFVGSILAGAAIVANTGANVTGRLLAETPAEVTLAANTITVPAACNTATFPTTTVTTTTTTTAPRATTTTTAATAVTTATSTPPGTTPPGTTPPITTTPSGGEIIPVGAPQTGAGGALSHAPDSVLVAFGGVALLGAGLAMNQAIRRRRLLHGRDGLSDSELGEDE